MLEIFAPYLYFFTFLIAIVINFLLVRSHASIWHILIMNVIVTLVLQLIGLEPYNFIGQILVTFVDILVDIVKSIWDAIFIVSI